MGGEDFRKTLLKPWIVEEKVVGETKTAYGLTWATVFDAGHMASVFSLAVT